METDLLLARLNDTVEAVYNTDSPKFLGFLSAEESALVSKRLKNQNIKFSLFGGFCEAQRVMLCCLPDWCDEPTYPITAVTVTFKPCFELTHRDFLGSVLGLGLKREAVGDILIEQGRAVLFLSQDIAKYVLDNLNKVGRCGVKLTEGFVAPLPNPAVMCENIVTVASLRLDCVVSAFLNCSRNTAAEFIENGLVSVNSVVTQKSTKNVQNRDIVSVRHKGKFSIVSSDDFTKKGRIVLHYKSY